MATLVFTGAYPQPMNPDDLAMKLATQFNLTSMPQVDIDPTSITVTHPQATEAQRSTIQTLINAYVLDPVRANYPPGNLGTLYYKADKALTTNQTYLGHAAVPSGTLSTAQLSALVRTLSDQTDSLTRQNNGLIRSLLNKLDDLTGT